MHSKRSAGFCSLFLALMLLGWSAVSRANTITVNSLNDPSDMGFCTLHDAIVAANSANNIGVNGCGGGSGTDTINFDVSSTISLAGSLPTVTKTLTIDGTGQSITIDGGSARRIISTATNSSLTVNLLTFSNGAATSVSGSGGAINNGGTLTVSNCTFSGNSSNFVAGAIQTNGHNTTVTGSTFSGNSATLGGRRDFQLGRHRESDHHQQHFLR